MLLKVGRRVYNLMQAKSIDLGDPDIEQIVLHFGGGHESVSIRGEAARKVRNALTNGELRVIDAADLPEPTPTPPETPTPPATETTSVPPATATTPTGTPAAATTPTGTPAAA